MTREIYVSAGPMREIAVVEDGRLVEYLREDAQSDAETICLGRVERIVPGMRAAFVDIGQEKRGFLPLDERSLTFRSAPLQSGDRVLTQIRKEAQGVKGAFLTRDVTFAGETVILMPLNRYVGVSSRIEDEADRRRLTALGQVIGGGAFGLVMRSAALDASEADIRAEVDVLWTRWESVRRAAPTAHAPSVLLTPRTLLDSVLDDYAPRGIDRIVTEDDALPARLAGRFPTAVEETGLMARHGWTRQRDKALERTVWLDCGGTLVFDACEALTVIDVNTAKFTGKRVPEETILRTNLEACDEIARQARLRNLGGVLIIDMIDMASEADRERVLAALREAFARDRVKTVIHGLTSLGLIEMTRKRTRRPLREEWAAVCPRCGGGGIVRLPEEEKHG